MSPSTHQDGLKVPEPWRPLKLYRQQAQPGDLYFWSADLPSQEAETYIPVSALLSDEVVDALGERFKERYFPHAFNAREILQAAIEQVGGGQGGS